ncbi:MAG: type II toxin-antitoxin system YafQ family toxin [Nitrospirae bacterium]|nr:type II toxin-antitoxin system YafQ family toxin [Nitrospirota bacterium]
MLTPSYTNRFHKDLKRFEKSGSKNIEKLKAVISILVNEDPLPARHRDHVLTGNYKGRRECHIKPDWLLVYKVELKAREIIFERTGTHSDLFG